MKTLLTAFTLAALGGLALATRSAPAPEASAVAAPAAETYQVDPGHSSVVFRTKHLGIAHFFGRFKSVSGKIEYDAASPSSSSVLIEIPVEGIDTNSTRRDGHLTSADFFSAKEFPTLLFESKSVKKDKDDLAVTGLLTLRDVTKEVSLKVTKVGAGDSPFGDYRMGWDTSFTVDMRDYGFAFVQQQPDAVGPEVEVWVSLETIRQ